MQKLVLDLIIMSMEASLVACVVLMLRQIFWKLPKSFTCVLWLLVLFRLLCPVTAASGFSLMPETGLLRNEGILLSGEGSLQGREQQESDGLRHGRLTGISGAGQHDGALPGTGMPGEKAQRETVGAGENGVTAGNALYGPNGQMAVTRQRLTAAAGGFRNFWARGGQAISMIWAAGVLALAGYYLWERQRLLGRIGLRTGSRLSVYEDERVTEPFVCGVLRPIICIPTNLDEREREFILRHERMHIRHGDLLIRALWQTALVLHWFNPLVWLIIRLVHRDMEMFCDEGVMRSYTMKEKQDYAMTLLRFAVKQSGLPFPVGFGESNTEGRIRHILKWKRPTFAVGAVAAVIVVLAVGCFLTDPRGTGEGQPSTETGIVAESEAEQPESALQQPDTIIEQPESEANQPSRTEQMLDIGEKWAEAFCRRDGRAMRSLLADPETMEKNGYTADDNGFYEVGWSSPWPSTNQYRMNYAYDRDEVEIYYYAFTSAEPVYYLWRQTVFLEKTEAGFAVGDWKTETDPATSAEDFWRMYHYLPQGEYGLSHGVDYQFKGTALDYFYEIWPDEEAAEPIAATVLMRKDANGSLIFGQPAAAAAMQLQLKGGKAVPVESPWENRYCLRWEFEDGQTDVICMRPLDEACAQRGTAPVSGEAVKGPWAVDDILGEQEYEVALEQGRLRDKYLKHPELLSEEALGAEQFVSSFALESAVVTAAALPEDKITLYGIMVQGAAEGVLLDTAGQLQYFYWVYATTRAIPPEIELRDFDGDGEKELAVFFHVLSGTEYSVEQLMMLKKDATGKWSATEYAADAVVEEIAKDISWYLKDDGTVAFMDNETRHVIGEEKLSEVLEEGEELETVAFDTFMDFSVGEAEGEENEIRLCVEIRYGVKGHVVGSYGNHCMDARVVYDGSSFALEDYRFLTKGMFGSGTE